MAIIDSDGVVLSKDALIAKAFIAKQETIYAFNEPVYETFSFPGERNARHKRIMYTYGQNVSSIDIDALGLTTGFLINTSGATFAPKVYLASGSTAIVTWTNDANGAVLATGLTPSINFGSVAARSVRMICTKPEDIVTVNFGFDHNQDSGPLNLGATYDYASQAITGVSDLSYLTGLKNFLAAGTNLTGTLDFTGLTHLEYVECFQAKVQRCILTGCTSLLRLCLEQNSLNTALDLNPVASTLYDFRAAAQTTNSLQLTPLTSNLSSLFHFCTRDQAVTGMPALSRFPVITQLWIWNTGQTTAVQPVSPNLNSFLAYQNNYNQASVDNILVGLQATAPNGGNLDLGTSSAAPSSTGLTAASSLTGRGWNITRTQAVLLQDTFATASGLWSGGAAASYGVSGGNFDLVTPSSGFQRAINSTTLPDDISIRGTRSSTVTTATNGQYFGLVARWDGSSGVRIFHDGNHSIVVGDASGYSNGNVTANATYTHPATWTVLRADLVGSSVKVYLDTTLVWDGVTTVNASGGSGHTVGFCGEPADMDLGWTDLTVLAL